MKNNKSFLIRPTMLCLKLVRGHNLLDYVCALHFLSQPLKINPNQAKTAKAKHQIQSHPGVLLCKLVIVAKRISLYYVLTVWFCGNML